MVDSLGWGEPSKNFNQFYGVIREHVNVNGARYRLHRYAPETDAESREIAVACDADVSVPVFFLSREEPTGVRVTIGTPSATGAAAMYADVVAGRAE